jgi:perosamine synthetase
LDFVFDDLERALDRETLCVVVPHLLGQPANLQRVKDMAAAHGVVVVEDAAQAMGGKDGEHFLGTQGDVGFFSLGRGKNVSAGSGGVLLMQSEKIAEAVKAVIREMPEPSPLQRVWNLATMVAMKLLIHPRLYWLPAGLPFLGLGETHFQLDFPMQQLDGARAGLLRTWRQRLMRSNEQRASKGQAYESALSPETRMLDPERSQASMALRFPLVLPKAAQKSTLCSQVQYKALGVSGLYPSAISEIPQLRSAFEGRRFPGAKALADRLVTLPVHHYVEPRDIQAICRLVGNMIHSGTPAVQSQAMATQTMGQRSSLVRL